MSARGITQEVLANKLDRGQSWVNHKLSGRRKTNVEDIVAIAQALDVPPADLLKNLSNPDQLLENFASAEPSAAYSYESFSELEGKLNQLEPGQKVLFLDQVDSMLDMLIASQTK